MQKGIKMFFYCNFLCYYSPSKRGEREKYQLDIEVLNEVKWILGQGQLGFGPKVYYELLTTWTASKWSTYNPIASQAHWTLFSWDAFHRKDPLNDWVRTRDGSPWSTKAPLCLLTYRTCFRLTFSHPWFQNPTRCWTKGWRGIFGGPGVSVIKLFRKEIQIATNGTSP